MYTSPEKPREKRTLTGIRPWAVLRGHQFEVRSVLFSPDNTMIASADGQDIRLWKRSGNTTFRLKHIIETSAEKLAVAPDGQYLVSCGGRGPIRWWTWKGEWIEDMPGNERDMAFSPDGLLFVTGDNFGHVKLWDAKTRTLLSTLHHIPDLKYINDEDPIADFAFSPDGQHLAFFCASVQGMIQICTIQPPTSQEEDAHWHLLWKQSLSSPRDWISALCFSPDGRFLVVAAAKQLWFFDTQSFALIQTIDIPNVAIAIDGLAFSPDGSLLAIATGEGKVHIWHVNSQHLAISFDAHADHPVPDYLLSNIGGIDWSPDGRFIVTGGMGVAQVYDRQKGHKIWGSNDYTIKIWQCLWSSTNTL